MAQDHNHQHGKGIDKLRVLLPHLKSHNIEHMKDLEKWIGEAEGAGLKDIVPELKKIMELSQEIDRSFDLAIEKLPS